VRTCDSSMFRRPLFIGVLALTAAVLAIVGHAGFEERAGVLSSPNAGWLTIQADEISPDAARAFTFKDAAARSCAFCLLATPEAASTPSSTPVNNASSFTRAIPYPAIT